MAQARKIPILSAEQEVELAKLVKQGGAAGDRARDRLITSNLRYVVSIAWKQVRDTVPLEDLVQEGNLGLFKAVEKFDHTRGFRFLTYARWWIQQGIRTYLDENGYAFRVPSHSSQKISKMHKAVARLLQRGSDVTDEAVAREMEVTVETVRDLAEWSRHPISIHAPILDGEGQVGDRIEDRDAVNPEAAAIEVDFKAKLTGSLDKLNEKQRQVITLRFGLDGQGERTLEEVGQIYSVTRERIRQIEAKALEILAGGKTGRTLKTFL
jgi:RNA polymerase primary sigma factor